MGFRFLIFLPFLLLLGCGNQDAPNSDLAPCPSTGAVIAVHSNLLQIVCGCAEASGTVSSPNVALTCTADVGDTVVFVFTADRIRQQLVPDGSPSIPPSGLYDTSDPNSISAHAFKIPASGTYRYKDVFNPSVVGEIVAP